MSDAGQSSNPDLKSGIPEADLADGAMLVGHVGEDAVLLARRGNEVFAIAATCTHYSGPLGEGLLVADTVRCPWHHACFSLRTGEALAAPALTATSCWRVERRDGHSRGTRRNNTNENLFRPVNMFTPVDSMDAVDLIRG
jgi:nitrite reductase/ring-hydroxylating ferredoxin subunit